MSDIAVVLVTCPDVDTAARLACSLVEERLAACGNVLPGLRSIYAWKGAVHDDAEVLLVLKTRRDRASELCDRVAALHPYEVPEAIALPVVSGLPAYLGWVGDQVDAPQVGPGGDR
ncbi:divalent-cation tolerance protein CutA [Myxococcota bacterium]|nr:divalent-cation tolerance protein CutA [Myxococcota bacterium]